MAHREHHHRAASPPPPLGRHTARYGLLLPSSVACLSAGHIVNTTETDEPIEMDGRKKPRVRWEARISHGKGLIWQSTYSAYSTLLARWQQRCGLQLSVYTVASVYSRPLLFGGGESVPSPLKKNLQFPKLLPNCVQSIFQGQNTLSLLFGRCNELQI